MKSELPTGMKLIIILSVTRTTEKDLNTSNRRLAPGGIKSVYADTRLIQQCCLLAKKDSVTIITGYSLGCWCTLSGY